MGPAPALSVLLVTGALSAAALSEGPAPITGNAVASPARLSIEFGGEVIVTPTASPTRWSTPDSGAAPAVCTLSRLYSSGGFALTREKLGPDFKRCCSLNVTATVLNASAVACSIPAGVIATEGNTTIVVGGAVAFVRHYAAFVPEFSRRPFIRESEGAILVRTPLALAPLVPTLTAQLPCGGPRLTVKLVHAAPAAPAAHRPPFVEWRATFSLAAIATTCYEVVAISLDVAGHVQVTRNRTFIRAAPPAAGTAKTAWQVDHESRGLLVDGRRLLAQGWFAGACEEQCTQFVRDL